jgi:hypothetical protein
MPNCFRLIRKTDPQAGPLRTGSLTLLQRHNENSSLRMAAFEHRTRPNSLGNSIQVHKIIRSAASDCSRASAFCLDALQGDAAQIW